MIDRDGWIALGIGWVALPVALFLISFSIVGGARLAQAVFGGG